MPAEQKETTEAARSAARPEGEARPAEWSSSYERGIEAVGKWETCFWFSTFPSAVVVGAAGNVGISPPFGEISKGLVERVGSRFLAFHAFHRPRISTALFFAAERQTVADPGQVPGKGGCASSTGARRSIVRLPSALLYVAES